MNIIEKYLHINEYSRPGKKLQQKLAVVIHWTGAPNQKAINTWGFFDNGCVKEKHYSSAQYIVDINGDVYHCVPDDEVAYHCGSSQLDPLSKKIYTDWARDKFGKYCLNPSLNSPNNCTIGIEMCVVDNNGKSTDETVKATIELTASLCKKYNIPADNICLHNTIVGWKDCNRYYVNNPEKFEEFKKAVKELL
jgi:N-acetylmuramoyl-L-alanine amidase